ncbi:16546_t:CDS:1, partial [Racocetra persica]
MPKRTFKIIIFGNCTKKVIKVKCNSYSSNFNHVSNQKNNESFENSKTNCKEVDVPIVGIEITKDILVK